MSKQLSLRAATNDDRPAMVALLAAEGLPEGGVATGLAHFHVLDDGNGVVAAAGIDCIITTSGKDQIDPVIGLNDIMAIPGVD